MGSLTGILGIVLLLGIGFIASAHRRRVDWRLVAVGMGMQFVLAALVMRFAPVIALFDGIAALVTRVISFADAGIAFVFGNVGDPSGPWGFVFAFRVLPVIVFFAALMSVLYHVGVMQRVVAGVAWVLRKALRITGVEALSAAANIFVGQTEAPLTVRPYIAGMTRAQLMAVMTGGFATIAGSVMAAYIGMLGEAYASISGVAAADGKELFAKHLLTASLMSAPAGIVFARLMMPEVDAPRAETRDALVAEERTTRNIVDAAAAGATDGLKLALNVAAMLVAFVALLALVDWPLTALSRVPLVAQWREAAGVPELSLRTILGYALSPVAWAMGVPWGEARTFASLLGTQVIATEFVAYADLAQHMRAGTISPRSAQIATYALCGFANVASIGIQIGGLSALAPERRGDLAALAPRAMVAGALACWTTGAVAGLFL